MTLPLLLLFISGTLGSDVITLECGKQYLLTAISQLYANVTYSNFPSSCSITVIPEPYLIPVFNLFGYSYDTVLVSSGGTQYSPGRYGSLAPFYENQTIYWIPLPFQIDFYIEEGINQFDLYMFSFNIRPNRTSKLIVNDDGTITFLDSEFLNVNRTAIQLYNIQNKTVQVRGFNYPEMPWNSDDQNTLYLYSNDTYICTAEDLISSPRTGHTATIYSIGNALTVIARNPQGKYGITFLAAINYTFPGEVQVRALSQSQGPISVDATLSPQIVHYVAPRLTNTIRYSIHFTFIGNGSLTFYAGAITSPMDNLLLVNIQESNADFVVPLTVKGRGRTLTLDYGQVIIDSDVYFKNQYCLVKAGQRGVFMSSNYPFSSAQEEFDAIKLYGANNETFTFYCEVIASGLMVGDFLTMGVRTVNGTNYSRSYTGPSQENFTATGTELYIRYTIGAQSNGMLVRYFVMQPEKPETSTKPAAILFDPGILYFIFLLASFK